MNGIMTRPFEKPAPLEKPVLLEKPARIDFLDTMRSFLIFMVIVFHVVIMYVPSFQFVPFILNNISIEHGTDYFIVVLLLNSETLNSAMFFIAGYFSLATLTRKGNKAFLKDKLVRLGIPYLCGMIILSPLAMYISSVSFGNQLGFFEFWRGSFLPVNIRSLHFWFIGVLLCFFLIQYLVFTVLKVSGRAAAVGIKAGKLPVWLALLFIVLTAGIYFAVNLRLPASNFTSLYFVNFQTVMIFVYMAYFTFGIYAYKKDWFKTGYRPRTIPWAIVYAVTVAIYVATNIRVLDFTLLPRIVNALSLNISMFSAIMAMLAIFQRIRHNNSPFLRGVSKSSYSAYIFHYIILYALVYLTRDVPMPQLPKCLLQIAICALLAFGTGHVLKKAPLLDRVL